MKHAIIVTVNLLVVALCVAAMGNEYAANVFTFVSSITFVMSLVAGIGASINAEDITPAAKVVRRAGTCACVICCIVSAAVGWFWLASCWFGVLFFTGLYRLAVDEAQSK